MRESYAETYHSKLEIEVREVKVYDSKFEDEDIERHPATKYFDGMNYEAISEILDTSVGALKASYHHAVKKIKTKLKDGN